MDNVPGRRFPVQKVLSALMEDVLLDVNPEKNSWVKTTAIGVPVALMDLPKMLNARNSIATKQAAVERPIVHQINFVILKMIDALSKVAEAAVEKRTQRVRCQGWPSADATALMALISAQFRVHLQTYLSLVAV